MDLLCRLFTDIGDAWGTQSGFLFTNPTLQTHYQQDPNFKPRASVGFGLRVTTPIGPIRLDYGYGVLHGEGGRLHFSIGQSF